MFTPGAVIVRRSTACASPGAAQLENDAGWLLLEEMAVTVTAASHAAGLNDIRFLLSLPAARVALQLWLNPPVQFDSAHSGAARQACHVQAKRISNHVSLCMAAAPHATEHSPAAKALALGGGPIQLHNPPTPLGHPPAATATMRPLLTAARMDSQMGSFAVPVPPSDRLITLTPSDGAFVVTWGRARVGGGQRRPTLASGRTSMRLAQ